MKLKPSNITDGQNWNLARLWLGSAQLVGHNFFMWMHFRLGDHSHGREKLLNSVIYQNIIWVKLFPSLHKFVHRIPLSKPLAHPLQWVLIFGNLRHQFYWINPFYHRLRAPDSCNSVVLMCLQLWRNYSCEVKGPNLVRHLYRRPLFEWFVVRCGSRNGHQKGMYSRDVGPPAQNCILFWVPYSRSIEGFMWSFKKKDNVHFDNKDIWGEKLLHMRSRNYEENG